MSLLQPLIRLQTETLTYLYPMGNVLLLGAMGAVLVVLVLGIILMATGGEKNRQYGNKLMGLRVSLQALALLLLAVLFFVKEGG